MLGLKLPTDPRWVNLAEKSLEEILTDHAYCEQKATSTCISLVQGYPEKPELVERVSPIVSEEWSHFRMVLAEMKKRGLALGRQRKDRYVELLQKGRPKGGSRDEQLVEKLFIAALIEARSCERFRLLSEQLKDAELREFYRKFMVSEAGHYHMFLELARLYAPLGYTDQRWNWWLSYEASIMKELEPRGDRVH